MKVLGLVLIVLGILAFVFGGITYTKREKVIDVGPIQASVNEKERIPLSPVAGGIAIAAGLALVYAGARRRTV